MSSTYVPPPLGGSSSGSGSSSTVPSQVPMGYGQQQQSQSMMGSYMTPTPAPSLPSTPIGEKMFGDTVGLVWFLMFFVFMIIASILIPVSSIPVQATSSNPYGIVSVDGLYAGILMLLLSVTFLMFYAIGTSVYRVDQHIDIRKYLVILTIVALVMSILVFTSIQGYIRL